MVTSCKVELVVVSVETMNHRGVGTLGYHTIGNKASRSNLFYNTKVTNSTKRVRSNSGN